MPSTSKKPTSSPVSIRRPDPRAWQAALAMADGDPSRLTLLEDGSVLVGNASRKAARPRWN